LPVYEEEIAFPHKKNMGRKKSNKKAVSKPPGSITSPSPDAMRPFRLVKNFTAISLVVIFVGTIFLSVIITHRARAVLLKKSEAYSLLLANNLNHQIFLQFLIPTVLQYGKIRLREKAQFERMDKVIKGTLRGFNVDNVIIYDINNVVSYSFDKNKIGKSMVAGIEFTQAMKGKFSSKLLQNGNFFAIMLGIPSSSRLITFAPLFAEEPDAKFSGRVLGVIEITQDLSGETTTIFKFQLLIVATSASVMLLLFLVLRFNVKSGEEILIKRAEERLRLEEQLGHAKRLASMGEMAAGVSHEIRNPLGIIRSSAQLLKKKLGSQDSSGHLLDVVVEESSRLNDIITDFLEFARPRKAKFESCRIDEVLEKSLAFLSTRLEEGQYSVIKHFQDNLPSIMLDPVQIHQCLLNILLNAMQAMPEGGAITVECIYDQEKVSISIADEGPGLNEDALKKIWDPFFTTKEKGTGLGLSVVRNIMEAHNGRIRIENRDEKGAVVWIELPVEDKNGNNINS